MSPNASGDSKTPLIVFSLVACHEKDLDLFQRRLRSDIGNNQENKQVAKQTENRVKPEGSRLVHGVLHVAETHGNN